MNLCNNLQGSFRAHTDSIVSGVVDFQPPRVLSRARGLDNGGRFFIRGEIDKCPSGM